MQKIIEQLRARSIPFNPTFDGVYRTHRGDGLAIGLAGHIRELGGRTVYSVLIKNWKTGEEEVIHEGNEGLTSAQLARFKKITDAESARHREETLQNQNETKARVAAFYSTLSEINGIEDLPPYMQRKKWGLWTKGLMRDSAHRDTIVVPMYDGSGVLWSLQKIFFSGEKQFEEGGRITGLFYTFGDLNQARTCFVAEGLATAMSIHLATGTPCVAALACYNLVHVAKELKQAHPMMSLIICGDDDKGNEVNIGRLKATDAAKATLSNVIFPHFLTGSGTDFNDLHVTESLDAVRNQLLSIEPEPQFVQALGFNKKKYFYTSSKNPQISALTDHSETDLFSLMPLEYWKAIHGELDAKGYERIDWQKVKSTLMDKCHSVGIFEPSRIRGSGVWEDEGKIVVHLGDRLFYDGADHELTELKTHNIYEFSKRIPPIEPHGLSLKEIEPIHDVLNSINYMEPEMKLYLGGFLALAPVCGALPWRPHLFLTGEQGSGKTTILNSLIKPLLDGFDFIDPQGSTTEAGLRQSTQSNAIPVVFDEFEGENRSSSNRIEKVLELFRQASSQNGGKIIKGSGTGEANEYSAQFMGIVSAIQPRIKAGADKARFTSVELRKIHGSDDNWNSLKIKLDQITHKMARGLFRRSLDLLPITLRNQAKLQDALAKLHSQRFGQQHGMLLAGYASLVQDTEMTPDEVDAMVRGAIKLEKDEMIDLNDSESDPTQCLQELIQAEFAPGKFIYKYLIKDSSNGMRDPELPDAIQLEEDERVDLAARGIFFTEHEKQQGLLISNSSPALRKIFKDSRWEDNWGIALARLKGIERGVRVRFRGKLQSRGVFIPLSLIYCNLP